MEKFNLILIHLFIAFLGFGQVTEYDYFEISQNKIKSIQEWNFRYDSIGNPVDSTLEYEFIYNESGDLIEKRYRFNKDCTLFIAIKNKYDNYHHLTESSWKNPYVILDGVYIDKGSLISKLELYNDEGFPMKTKLTYTLVNQNSYEEIWLYQYNQGLLINKQIFIGDILIEEIKIKYKK